MPDNDKTLSPDASPNTAVMGKKGARRVNRRPLAIGIAIIAVIAATLGSAAMNRGGIAQSDGSSATGKPAMDQAREFIAGPEAGIVAPKEPEIPQAAQTPPEPVLPVAKEEEKLPVAPAPQIPEPPRLSDEERRFREKRFRQVEAALDSPIKAQIEDVKTTPRFLDAEIPGAPTAFPGRVQAVSGCGVAVLGTALFFHCFAVMTAWRHAAWLFSALLFFA